MPWAIIRNLKFKKTVNHTHRGHESQRRIFREPTDRLGRSRVRRPPRRQRVQRAGGDNGRGKKHDGERPPCAQESRRSRVATDDAALRPLADFFRCRGRRHRWRVVKVDRLLAIRRVRPRRETISRAPRRTRTTRESRRPADVAHSVFYPWEESCCRLARRRSGVGFPVRVNPTTTSGLWTVASRGFGRTFAATATFYFIFITVHVVSQPGASDWPSSNW